MIAIAGLDDDGQADLSGSLPGILRARDEPPSGTGTPQDLSSSFVRSLSRDILSAIAGVRSVSAVQMR